MAIHEHKVRGFKKSKHNTAHGNEPKKKKKKKRMSSDGFVKA